MTAPDDSDPVPLSGRANEINIAFSGLEPLRWSGKCRLFALKVLQERGINNWEVSILFCNERYIRELNRRYRGIDRPTDVLSFSQFENRKIPSFKGRRRIAGDVVICLEELKRDAARFDTDEEDELKRLVVHGLLHLEGMDHPEGTLDSEMITIQEEILKALAKEKIF